MANPADTLGERLAMECAISDVLEDAYLIDNMVLSLFESEEAWDLYKGEKIPGFHLYLFNKTQVRLIHRANAHVLNSARELAKLFHGDDDV